MEKDLIFLNHILIYELSSVYADKLSSFIIKKSR